MTVWVGLVCLFIVGGTLLYTAVQIPAPIHRTLIVATSPVGKNAPILAEIPRKKRPEVHIRNSVLNTLLL